MKSVRILNIDILSITERQLLEQFESGVLFTPNVDHLMNLQKDPEFYAAYRQADYVVCDSQIIHFISYLLRDPIAETIAGSDFLSSFYYYHKNNPNMKMFFLGAAEGVARTAMKIINKKVGRDIVVGAHSPSFGFEKNEDECSNIVNIINSSDANVLIVGVGSPKQEKWIVKYKDQLPGIKIFMGLGATIDFEANAIPRSPRIFRRLGLEWLHRLCMNPKKLWRRYLINDLPFFVLIFRQKLKHYKDPFAG
ncbi:MAG: WecB/TagA/CpsF family glycosyltransferase [Tannerellaceae bacterium]|jgi:exopolysaccharide biosynthesis WecB/TagA/CpsF family protein|nr:WecB/TagA/CpsF family glycosyltransferase [Tannerellaceae bacterium]